MNQREIAKMKMYPALNIFLTDPAAALIIANDNPFKAAVIEYGAKLLVVNNCAIPLSIDNTVYSQAKTDAKGLMADEAAALSGRALVALNKLNKTTEAGQLHIFASDYMHLSDPEAIALGQSAHDLLAGAAIFPFISPDYVTAQNLLDYQGLVTTYSGTQGTSAAVHAGTPEDLKNFKKAILAIDGTIADMFLLAASYKKEATSAFYSAFIAQSTIPAVHVSHTSMSLLVKRKTDSTIITGASASLSNSKKTGTSDASGIIILDQIRHGNPTLTIKANGLTDYSSLVHISSGQDNHFEIFM